jgi:hypothetical protein
MEDLERDLLSFPVNREKRSGITAPTDLTFHVVLISEGMAYEPQEPRSGRRCRRRGERLHEQQLFEGGAHSDR